MFSSSSIEKIILPKDGSMYINVSNKISLECIIFSPLFPIFIWNQVTLVTEWNQIERRRRKEKKFVTYIFDHNLIKSHEKC